MSYYILNISELCLGKGIKLYQLKLTSGITHTFFLKRNNELGIIR